MKNKNLEILNSLYQNTSMGISALEKIIPKVSDSNLKGELQAQLRNYNEQNQHLTQAIYSFDAAPKDLGAYTKASADIGITMNTLVSTSPSHIAKMMIQGTDMGIIDINETLNKCNGIDQNVVTQATDILSNEQQYIEKLKKYL